MGPRNRPFWLPLARLGAFFAAVVVAGNLLLHALRPSTIVPEGVDGTLADTYARARRRVEKRWRMIDQFWRSGSVIPSSGPSGSDATPASPGSASGEPPAGDVAYFIAPGDDTLAVASPPELRLELEPQLPAFIWPEASSLIRSRPIDRVPDVDFFDGPGVTAELVAAWSRENDPGALGSVLEDVMKGPEALFDEVVGLARMLAGPPDEGGGVTSRLLDIDIGRRRRGLVAEFVSQWGARESRYFAKFGESEVDTPGFEDGREEADHRDLMRDQRKVMWDALRKTYLSKYRVPTDDRIKDEAFSFGDWRGVDFIALPPLMGGFVWFRGLEKRFHFGDVVVRVELEALSEWMGQGDDEDLWAGASLECSLKGFPVGVIVSSGLHEGKAGLDFVGIGTSIGTVKKALRLQREE